MKHTEGFLAVVNDAKSRIRELTVAETQQRLDQNADAKLIDVRGSRCRDRGSGRVVLNNVF